MGDFAEVKIEGLKELNQALKLLPDRVARNVLRGATSAGAAVIRKEASDLAPIYIPRDVMWGGNGGGMSANHPPPGTLKRTIYQKQIAELSGLLKQTFYVGVRTGKSQRDRKGRSLDAWYWRFVEFGTVKMSARPFMRPAFEAKKQAAVDAIKNYMTERIPREVDKLPKGPLK